MTSQSNTRKGLLRLAALAALTAVASTLVVPSSAVATNYCRNWGVDWNRPLVNYDVDFSDAAYNAATQQATRSGAYDAGWGAGYKSDGLVYWLKKWDAVAVTVATHGNGELGETALCEAPASGDTVSCFRIANDCDGQIGINYVPLTCTMHKLTSELAGGTAYNGAQIVMVNTCESALISHGYSNGVVGAIYANLLSCQTAYGFSGETVWQKDAYGNDMVSRRFQNKFWEQMAAGHSVAYAQSLAKADVFTYSGGVSYLGYDTGKYSGSGNYILPN